MLPRTSIPPPLLCIKTLFMSVCAALFLSEYSSTLHNVLVGLESSSLALWKLVALAGGYLGLLLFTVYLASSEVRLPIVQYAKGPPPVSGACSTDTQSASMF